MITKKILMPLYYFENYLGENPKTFKIFDNNQFREGDHVFILETNPFEVLLEEEIELIKTKKDNLSYLFQESMIDIGKNIIFFTGRFMLIQLTNKCSDLDVFHSSGSIFQFNKIADFNVHDFDLDKFGNHIGHISENAAQLLLHVKQSDFIHDDIKLKKPLLHEIIPQSNILDDENNIELLAKEINKSHADFQSHGKNRTTFFD